MEHRRKNIFGATPFYGWYSLRDIYVFRHFSKFHHFKFMQFCNHKNIELWCQKSLVCLALDSAWFLNPLR